MKPERVTLTLIRTSPDNPHRFNVTVEGYGTPDFAILAGSAQSAKETLKEFVYNELDHRDGISDGEVQDDGE